MSHIRDVATILPQKSVLKYSKSLYHTGVYETTKRHFHNVKRGRTFMCNLVF